MTAVVMHASVARKNCWCKIAEVIRISVIPENSISQIMNLAPLTQRFVLHFGEMGSRWGINRTVGQIYALLYVS
ncbi:MAG: MarR family transcriptional regulator, partial [Nitrososphaera sp.]